MRHFLRGRGRSKEHFLNNHKYSTRIHPENFLCSLLPNDPQIESKVSFCTDDLADLTNTKDILDNYGRPNKKYPIFNPCTTR